MSAKEILKMGNPLLREVAEDFSIEEIKSSETKELIKDMWDSLEAAGGIGLAAPQIGISKQLAVIRLSEESERYPDMEDSEAFVIFNPKITVMDETEQGFWEGCLSVPGQKKISLSSSDFTFSGRKSVPSWEPSQKGCLELSPQRHQK